MIFSDLRSKFQSNSFQSNYNSIVEANSIKQLTVNQIYIQYNSLFLS